MGRWNVYIAERGLFGVFQRGEIPPSGLPEIPALRGERNRQADQDTGGDVDPRETGSHRCPLVWGTVDRLINGRGLPKALQRMDTTLFLTRKVLVWPDTGQVSGGQWPLGHRSDRTDVKTRARRFMH